MVKIDLRKKVKLTIECTERDLERFESLMLCMPVCGKHSMHNLNTKDKSKHLGEWELMTMYYECEDCERVYNNWKRGAERIFWRLAREHYKRYDNNI